jgi:RNA polymerase-binding protein DksA
VEGLHSIPANKKVTYEKESRMQKQIVLKELEDRLHERKVVLAHQIEIEGEKVLPGSMSSQDSADLAYDNEYRAHHAYRVKQLENQLSEVDKALKRMKDGIYGACTNCGTNILPERLEALPYAELCINCQRQGQ